jgi:predicted metal-dependent hydrolase
MTYTYDIKGLITKSDAELGDVVKIVEVEYKAITESKHYTTLNFNLDLTPPESGSFIQYDELTKDQVMSWIDEQLNERLKISLQESLNKKIDDILNPPNIVRSKFPWEPK